MQIVTYRTELNENRHNILVQEDSHDYSVSNFDSPKYVVDMINSIFNLNKQAEEYIYMIALNTKNMILGVFEVSHGSVNWAICGPREIFIRALLCGASKIILVHNHPSGICNPSSEDINVYKKISEAGELIGIMLVDSIIIGDGYYSFMENM